MDVQAQNKVAVKSVETSVQAFKWFSTADKLHYCLPRVYGWTPEMPAHTALVLAAC